MILLLFLDVDKDGDVVDVDDGGVFVLLSDMSSRGRLERGEFILCSIRRFMSLRTNVMDRMMLKCVYIFTQ